MTAATDNSPPSHSLRRPTLDGDAGDDDGDEAQVDVCRIRRLRPCRPPACLSQSSPADAVVGHPPGLSHEAQSYTTPQQ